jgi:hypothetical protein
MRPTRAHVIHRHDTIERIRSNPSAPSSLRTTKLNPFKSQVYELSINTYLFIRARLEDVGGEEQLARISQLVEWLFSKWAFYD